VLFTGTFVVLELVRGSEYDRVAETVSALEAGPHGWVQQVNFVVFGLLTIGFAAGLRGRSHLPAAVSPGCHCSGSAGWERSWLRRSRCAKTPLD
jgi:hypothetical protein